MVHPDAAIYRAAEPLQRLQRLHRHGRVETATGIPIGFIVNSTIATTRIASFQCPSDNTQTFALAALAAAAGSPVTPSTSYTKGNYGVNWGNTDFGQGVAAAGGFFPSNLYFQAPFGINTSATGPSSVSFATITDGTSNTHFLSELLQGATDDIRGTIWSDMPGAGSYMTRFTPNGYQDYVLLNKAFASQMPAGALANDNMDNLPSFGARQPGTSPASLAGVGGLCDSQPVQGLACYNQGSPGGVFVGTRSRHPGGVNSLFGDGSVHFIKNSISPMTWVALGSINGGEVIGSDSY